MLQFPCLRPPTPHAHQNHHTTVTHRVPDGAAAAFDSLAAAEKSGASVNYGGMKLGRGGEAASAITLDSLRLDNVSFIKVDVQGAEKLMLYGARVRVYTMYTVVQLSAWFKTPVYERLSWGCARGRVGRRCLSVALRHSSKAPSPSVDRSPPQKHTHTNTHCAHTSNRTQSGAAVPWCFTSPTRFSR